MSQKTRAAITPPKRTKSFLPDPQPITQRTANNMASEKLAPMTFNMPRNWHTEFKMTAAAHGMSMKELLMECFDQWKKQNS